MSKFKAGDHAIVNANAITLWQGRRVRIDGLIPREEIPISERQAHAKLGGDWYRIELIDGAPVPLGSSRGYGAHEDVLDPVDPDFIPPAVRNLFAPFPVHPACKVRCADWPKVKA